MSDLLNVTECCADCDLYDVCNVAVHGRRSIVCLITLGVTCPECREFLIESNNTYTDLYCSCCKREYELHNGKLICTI